MVDLSFGTDVEINGKRVSAEAIGADLEVKSEVGPERRIRACFTNRSGKTICFGGFRFELRTFHGIPGERVRIYREGWTMTSASGSVRYGECDFDANPDYLKYAVSDPGNYRSDEPNHFSAEHVVVLNDRDTGYSLLAGFVSSADQLTRFDVVLNEHGLARFTAFSCCDGIEVAPGEAIHSEELVIFDGDDGYGLLERFAGLWGKRMNALVQGQIPTGWCSWYYYFHGVTENDILENLRYLVSHRQQFPLEYIQLDEGYQSMLGDWLTCNEAFPHGLEFLARKIRDGGFKPGVWVAPYMVDERSRLFARHPDWMIHNADGEIIRVTTWHGGRVAALDTTHPGALAYLTEVFTTLAQWGFEYFKLDFLVYACAGNQRIGRFEEADGGTVFLDEIGELSLGMQTKLLRVIQERTFERVGGNKPIRVELRIITATNRNLAELVAAGKFREDLFYRLNVFPITIPPLRERGSDIITLAEHFVARFAKSNGKEIKRIATPAIDMLMSYHWPGNVRELENVMERVVILSDDNVIHGYNLPPSLQTGTASGTAGKTGLLAKLDIVSCEMIVDALQNSGGNMSEAARELGLTRHSLRLRMDQIGRAHV